MSDLLVTDVVTWGRARAATRSPEGALRAPRPAVRGRGEAGASARWRSPAVGGGWQGQPASPRECVLRAPVPGLRGPKRAAAGGGPGPPDSPGTRAPRRSAGAVTAGAGPAEVCRAGQAPPGLRAGSCWPVAVCPCGAAGRRREASGQRLRPASREAEASPRPLLAVPLRARAAAASLPPWRAAFLCGAVMLCSVSDRKLEVPG